MEESDLEPYLHKSKTDVFVKDNRRSQEKELFRSEKYFLDTVIEKGHTVLDVGCAAGGIYNILKNKIGDLKYTGLDIDAECIKAASERYPDATFLAGSFLDNTFTSDSFDVVISMLVMGMQPDYKKFISEFVRVSRQYVIFDARLRYDGTTVVDKDLSYFYYHGSGQRNYYVVHNVFELINFLHIESLHLKKIRIYGYHPEDRSSAFVPMPKNEMVVATICLEKYPQGERDFVRYGGSKKHADRAWCEVDIQLPGFKDEWI